MRGDSDSSYVSRSKVYINQQEMQNVKKRLTREAELTGWERTPSTGICIFERKVGYVTDVEAFNKWTERHKLRADCIAKEIILREISFSPRGMAVAHILGQFQQQGLRTGAEVNLTTRITGSVYVPDGMVILNGPSNRLGACAPNSNLYPAIIIEVALSQSPLDLHQRAAIYLSAECPGVEFYIGIKRYEIRSDGLQAMFCSVYDRVTGFQPVTLISFGTGPLHHSALWTNAPILQGVGAGGPPCNMLGIPNYILNFPAARVHQTQVAGVPGGAPVNYQIDLFPIQEALSAPPLSL